MSEKLQGWSCDLDRSGRFESFETVRDLFYVIRYGNK
jgi:hypothetical protein